MRRRVKLQFDEFGRVNLEQRAQRDGVSLDRLLETAAAYYLLDGSANRMASRVPRLERGAHFASPSTIELDLADGDWHALEAEARRQGVAVERLLEHAALYYLADLNSGRVATRIHEGPKLDGE